MPSPRRREHLLGLKRSLVPSSVQFPLSSLFRSEGAGMVSCQGTHCLPTGSYLPPASPEIPQVQMEFGVYSHTVVCVSSFPPPALAFLTNAGIRDLVAPFLPPFRLSPPLLLSSPHHPSPLSPIQGAKSKDTENARASSIS
jgi:hypothetical protein